MRINTFSGLCGGVVFPLTPFNNSGLNAAVAVGVKAQLKSENAFAKQIKEM